MGKNATRKIAVAGVVAAAAGYVAGILTAPKSGKETRKDIKVNALKAKAEAEKQLKRLHSELDELVKKGTGKAKNLKDAAQKELVGAVGKAQLAKDRVRETLSRVHEEGAEDADLQKAIKEANEAVDNLKKYISKHTS